MGDAALLTCPCEVTFALPEQTPSSSGSQTLGKQAAAAGVQAMSKLQNAALEYSGVLWLNFPVEALGFHDVLEKGPAPPRPTKTPSSLGESSVRLRAASVHGTIAALKIKAVALKKCYAVPLNR